MTSRRNTRRGYSLIETVVVVGAVTIVLSLCGLILHGMLRLDKSGRGAMEDAATIRHLARQFREDVHDASTAEASESKDKSSMLTLKREGATIEYKLVGIRLIRAETLADGTPRDREGYRIDRLGPVVFEVEVPVARLTFLRTPVNPAVAPHPPIVIDAELGKSLRMSESGEVKP